MQLFELAYLHFRECPHLSFCIAPQAEWAGVLRRTISGYEMNADIAGKKKGG
jgi:hypothetical protein